MNSNTTEVKEFSNNTIDNSFKGMIEKHFGCKCDINRSIDICIYSKKTPYKKEMELMKMFPNMRFDFRWINNKK